MTAALVIRPATAADEAALGRYGAALMREHHAFDAQRFFLPPDPERGYGRFLVSAIGDKESVVFVAERDGVVIGYVYAGLEPLSWKDLRAACGFVHDVYVDENARGMRAGERLTRTAIEWLEAHGAPRVVVQSAARNDKAQRLFDRLGFRRTMIEMTREAGPQGA